MQLAQQPRMLKLEQTSLSLVVMAVVTDEGRLLVSDGRGMIFMAVKSHSVYKSPAGVASQNAQQG